MNKIYFILLPVFLASCYSAQVRYIGDSYEPTVKVEVFVDPSAIKKPYTIVGKGYVNTPFIKASERIQYNAVLKAKEKGADAVLFQDVVILSDGTSINSRSQTDSVGRSLITQSHTTLSPIVNTRKEILFLKYD